MSVCGFWDGSFRVKKRGWNQAGCENDAWRMDGFLPVFGVQLKNITSQELRHRRLKVGERQSSAPSTSGQPLRQRGAQWARPRDPRWTQKSF